MKNNHGGKREGAGAKLKFNEATEVLSVRVPSSHKEEIRNKILNFLKKYKK